MCLSLQPPVRRKYRLCRGREPATATRSCWTSGPGSGSGASTGRPNASSRATALVSHLHWDHVQGLPFFEPVNRPGAKLDVFGPPQVGQSLADAVNGFMSPPYFPVSIAEFAGAFTFTEVTDHFTVDGYDVRTIPVPHPGPTVGYRVERGGVSIAYLPDHQQPGCGSTFVSDEVRSLCGGVDLLIHDAQYNDAEFARKSDWGHCTYDYAMEVARQSGARRLALFHHDPSRDDDQLDEIAQMMAKVGAAAGLEEVIVASERLQISLAPSRTR